MAEEIATSEVKPIWWARIEENRVVELINDPDPRPNYHESIKWIKVPDGLELFVNTEWVGPAKFLRPPSLDYFSDQIKGVIAASRWHAQTSGITIDEKKYHTDEASTSTYTGAVVQGQAYESIHGAGSFRTVWKTAGTGFVELGLTDLISIGGAVALYVSRCFAREEQIVEKLATAMSGLVAELQPPTDPTVIAPPKDFDVSVIWTTVEPELAVWPDKNVTLASLRSGTETE